MLDRMAKGLPATNKKNSQRKFKSSRYGGKNSDNEKTVYKSVRKPLVRFTTGPDGFYFTKPGVVYLAGAAKSNKTSLAMNMLLHGHKAATFSSELYSLEMTQDVMDSRFIAMMSKLPLSTVLRYETDGIIEQWTKSEDKKIRKAIKRLVAAERNKQLTVRYPQEAVRLSDILNTIEKRTDIVVIDTLSNVVVGGVNSQTWENYAAFGTEIARKANEMDKCFVVLCHTNKENELARSSLMGNNATAIWHIAPAPDEGENVYCLYVKEQRNMPGAPVSIVRFDYETRSAVYEEGAVEDIPRPTRKQTDDNPQVVVGRKSSTRKLPNRKSSNACDDESVSADDPEHIDNQHF